MRILFKLIVLFIFWNTLTSYYSILDFFLNLVDYYLKVEITLVQSGAGNG